MQFIKQIIKKIDDYFSRDERIKLRELEERLMNKEIELNALKERSKEVEDNLNKELIKKDYKINQLNKELEDLYSELEDYKNKLKVYEYPNEIKRLVKYFDNKYPKKHITYFGITLYTKKFGDIRPAIYIPDYIQSFRSLELWLEEKGLTLLNYLKKYKDYMKAIDELRFDIYKEFLKEKKYMLDNELWGDKEFWSPALFSWYLRKRGKFYGDCDSQSIVLMSLFKSAKLPRLQRLVAGKTYSGYGHATVHIFSLKDKIWLQYEPTATSPYVFDKDKDRPIALKQVWFSADWKYAWSTMPENDLKKKIKTLMRGDNKCRT